MNKYHINPNTGVPGVCYAQQGNCPYGDESQHYSSYEEAQDIAFSRMENEYPMFHGTEDVFMSEDDEEIEQIEEYLSNFEAIEEEYDYLNSIDLNEALEEVAVTKDEGLLDGILSQRVVIGNDDNEIDMFIQTAIKNENLPEEWVQDAIHNPNSYDNRLMREFCSRPSLTEADLMGIAGRTRSVIVRDAALKDPRISTETIILNLGEDGMAEAPELALHLGKNPNCPPNIRHVANQRLVKLRSDRMKAENMKKRGY